MSFRFLHTADWQIGKPFGNVPGDSGAELRRQRIATIESLARLAANRALDAVLVAGDVFDSNEVEDRTIVRLLNALEPFSGPWVLLPGNHDAALPHSVWTRLRQLQPGANIVIADKAEPIMLGDGRAVVLPAPLLRRRETVDLTSWFDSAATAPSVIRIGLAHGSVANRLPAASEAANEIADDRANSARLDYLALGDWHGTIEIAPRTWYSGTPETDRHRANHSGHALIVEIDHPGAPPRVTATWTGGFHWRQLSVALVDASCDAVLAALEGLGAAPERIILELSISGTISLAERYRLEEALTAWRARLHHLVVNDGDLHEEPTDDDLSALDSVGFVRLAVERLRALAADEANGDSATARAALRMIYLDHMRSGSAS